LLCYSDIFNSATNFYLFAADSTCFTVFYYFIILVYFSFYCYCLWWVCYF